MFSETPAQPPLRSLQRSRGWKSGFFHVSYPSERGWLLMMQGDRLPARHDRDRRLAHRQRSRHPLDLHEADGGPGRALILNVYLRIPVRFLQ